MEPVGISLTTIIGFRRCQMETYAGIDLHSSNNYIGIMDQDHKRLFGRRLPNSLDKILMVLEPFKSDLKGIVVEST